MQRFPIDHLDDLPGMSPSIRFDLIANRVVYNLANGDYISAGWEIVDEDGERHTRQWYSVYQR